MMWNSVQGDYRAVPIAEGRKVLSELGQRTFALGDDKLPGHLEVLNSISQKKLKVRILRGGYRASIGSFSKARIISGMLCCLRSA